ncbi:MAG: thiol:disulfide interchange protein DsbA/DsbL [Pseudomonadales bacterium]|nr:thiol:disulfide interchange protein DsbA/DsbL [Pseudomonadales bacterium]
MRIKSLISMFVSVFFAQILFVNIASGNDLVFEEGIHYVELPIPLRTKSPDIIEVAEHFSYGCPHCFQFEPLISSWHESLPADVSFDRTPALYNQEYLVYAQTYYAAKTLKVLDKVHKALFNAIHGERRRLNTPQSMAVFFTEFGVAAEDFARAYNSFGVRAGVQQADSKGRAYRSSGVPAMVVNGKYRVEGAMAGSNANMIRVVNFLIEKERQSIKGS